MQGFATIGALYILSIRGFEKSTWVVIENNSNENKTILENIEEGPNYGIKISVDAAKLNEREPLGPILNVNGEIVIEDGREFIKPSNQKIKH